ncbi:hypothetical protein NT6N_30010 [Oceaniferula spumae]|uniref:TerC family protein n=1 Tax=Oceaniferula spumae TaxID=2979115 RepID=A0AAT9FPK7_9BACT
MGDLIATLLLLFALEIVLGVDNIVVITIIVSKLPKELRDRARRIGLSIALVARLLMVMAFSYILSLTHPFVFDMSIRDLMLLGGGLFLIWKAVREIHNTVELREEKVGPAKPRTAMLSAISLIVVMDVVFALDSVVTAFGLTDHIYTIAAAVILSFVVLLFAAGPIGEFVIKNPSFKILALSFLVTIGVMLILEAFHHDVPKPYIYLPMGFATLIQLLQWRLSKNQNKAQV